MVRMVPMDTSQILARKMMTPVRRICESNMMDGIFPSALAVAEH
jgi:hypothetical protein